MEITVCCVALTVSSCGGGSSSPGGSSPMTYTLGGTISGLSVDSGLVLLNNGGDATTVAANSAAFTMKTPVASGSAYDITVGRQPYGLTLACSVSGGSGTATADVTSITVSCRNVTPTQEAVATVGSGFSSPVGFAVDANGNLFIADTAANAIQEIPYAGGAYQTAVTVGTGLGDLLGVAVGANGDLFVAQSTQLNLTEIPFSGGAYQTPVPLGLGLHGPLCVTLDANDDLFLVDNANAGPPPDQPVDESLFSGGAYHSPVVTVGTVVAGCSGIAVDVNHDVFVTSNGAVYEIPFSGGSYGAVISLDAGSGNFRGVAVDANGDVFVADIANNVVKEIPFSGGSYGTPVALGSGFNAPFSVAVDQDGRVYVLDLGNIWRLAT